MAMKILPRFKVLAFFVFLCVVIHLLLGLYAMGPLRRHFNLKPRHVTEFEVRGRTYHVHLTDPVDTKLRNAYLKNRRLVEEFRPHLVARRDILELRPTKSTAKQKTLLGISGEEETLRLQCNTCSLVGTAGSILGSNMGTSIDSRDCVFRLGLSPTATFEDDVGSKTTVRVVDGGSLGPFLKKPSKLIQGPLATLNLVVFDSDKIDDRSKFHINLRRLSAKHNFTAYVLSRHHEYQSLKTMQDAGANLGYKMIGAKPSTLWYAVELMESTGCSSYDIVAVPSPKHCKSVLDSPAKSKYWDRYSVPLCTAGNDAGVKTPDLSVNDRRALLSWAADRHVNFTAPEWL